MHGIEALQNALRNINAATKRQELSDAFTELVARVQDWKNHKVHDFGDLLLFDILQVIDGKSRTQRTVRTKFCQ
jgi:cell division control protein 24